jgi:hypothetical protein
VELAVGRDDPRALAQRQRRQPSNDQFVRVLPERDVPRYVTNEAGEALADPLRLRRGFLPLQIDELGRVEPGPLLRREPDIGPGLMRVSGQQEALRDAEVLVVDGEISHWRSTTESRKS